MENVNIEDIKKDIAEQDCFIELSKKKAETYQILFVASLCIFIYSIIIMNLLMCGTFFVFGFLCLRGYNITIGKVEVHTAIKKFLKTLLIQEQTGQDVFKSIVG